MLQALVDFETASTHQHSPDEGEGEECKKASFDSADGDAWWCIAHRKGAKSCRWTPRDEATRAPSAFTRNLQLAMDQDKLSLAIGGTGGRSSYQRNLSFSLSLARALFLSDKLSVAIGSRNSQKSAL